MAQGDPGSWWQVAVESCGDAVFVTDREARIEWVNDAFERVTGYLRAEAVGATPTILRSGVHTAELYRELWSAVGSGQVWRARLVNRRKDGSLIHVAATISPLRDQYGEVTGFVAVERDVSEEEALRRRLRQAQRLETIGVLANGIAHEFNNILYVILGFTELAQMRGAHGRPADAQLTEVLGGVERARSLVGQILALGRGEEEPPRAIQLHPIVKEALKLLRSALPPTIAIQQGVDASCPPVVADPVRFHQVVTSLCAAAVEGLGDREAELVVRLERQGAATGSESVTLTVAGGRLPQTAGSTEPASLAAVREVVASLGGELEREADGGIAVRFPVAASTHPAGGPARVEPAAGSARVVCVGSHAQLVELQREQLVALGFRVTATTSGKAALAMVREAPEAFDLVLAERSMPGVDGERLAVELREVRPTLPVVLVADGGEQVTEARAAELGLAAILVKPVSAAALAQALRRALDAATAAG